MCDMWGMQLDGGWVSTIMSTLGCISLEGEGHQKEAHNVSATDDGSVSAGETIRGGEKKFFMSQTDNEIQECVYVICSWDEGTTHSSRQEDLLSCTFMCHKCILNSFSLITSSEERDTRSETSCIIWCLAIFSLYMYSFTSWKSREERLYKQIKTIECREEKCYSFSTAFTPRLLTRRSKYMRRLTRLAYQTVCLKMIAMRGGS